MKGSFRCLMPRARTWSATSPWVKFAACFGAFGVIWFHGDIGSNLLRVDVKASWGYRFRDGAFLLVAVGGI